MLLAQRTIAKDTTTRGLRTQHNKHLNTKHKQTNNDIEEDVAFFTQTLQGGNNNASTRKARKAKIIHTSNNMNGKQGDDITEDVAFWTRALQSSMPPTPRPPTPRPPTPNPPPTRPPTPITPAPVPVPVSTPNPTELSVTPAPVPTPTFNCPSAEFVGCTAPDPQDFEDECPTIGQPCIGGNPGEFCCRDACPRNYCTAKQAPAMVATKSELNGEVDEVQQTYGNIVPNRSRGSRSSGKSGKGSGKSGKASSGKSSKGSSKSSKGSSGSGGYSRRQY